MSARDRIIARIRAAQGSQGEPSPAVRAAVERYISQHPEGPRPRSDWDPVVRFRERALSLSSTVETVANLSAAPQAVARYLAGIGLPRQAVCWPELAELDWGTAGVAVETRPARGDDLVGVTGAFCAIAETGTLMLLSGPRTPAATSLLPETHIAILHLGRIVPGMEDAWALARVERGQLPRAVNFVSGPSRTADIEQTINLGAHGPYRVHIVIVAGV
ncbi:MAG TPA: lactate utilization protein C [Burkholderiales bacterium]